MTKFRFPQTVLVAVLALASVPSLAASFHGRVTLPDGRPAYGAMVSVSNAAHTQRQTVYTDVDGRYAIVTPYEGSLGVRARLANYADANATCRCPA